MTKRDKLLEISKRNRNIVSDIATVKLYEECVELSEVLIKGSYRNDKKYAELIENELADLLARAEIYMFINNNKEIIKNKKHKKINEILKKVKT